MYWNSLCGNNFEEQDQGNMVDTVKQLFMFVEDIVVHFPLITIKLSQRSSWHLIKIHLIKNNRDNIWSVMRDNMTVAMIH